MSSLLVFPAALTGIHFAGLFPSFPLSETRKPNAASRGLELMGTSILPPDAVGVDLVIRSHVPTQVRQRSGLSIGTCVHNLKLEGSVDRGVARVLSEEICWVLYSACDYSGQRHDHFNRVRQVTGNGKGRDQWTGSYLFPSSSPF